MKCCWPMLVLSPTRTSLREGLIQVSMEWCLVECLLKSIGHGKLIGSAKEGRVRLGNWNKKINKK